MDNEEWERRRQSHAETKEKGWSTRREANMNSGQQSRPSGKKSSRKSYVAELAETVQDLKNDPDTKNITLQQVILEDGTPISMAAKAELDPDVFSRKSSGKPSMPSRRNVSNEVPTRPSQAQFIPKEKGRSMTISVKRNHGAAREERVRNDKIMQAKIADEIEAIRQRIKDEDKAAKLAAKQAARSQRPSRKLPSRRISETDDVFAARVEAEGLADAMKSRALRSMRRAVAANEKEARKAYHRGQIEAKGVGRYVVSNIRRGVKQTVEDIDTEEMKEKAIKTGKKVGGAVGAVAKKHITKSNVRKVGKGIGAVVKGGGAVVGETANAIGDAAIKIGQAQAIRDGVYQDGEKTKRVYYYPDGTVKEVVETQKPGTIRRSAADKRKKQLGPGGLGYRANVEAKGKPGPGRRTDTIGRRSAKTIGKNQHDLVKVQNGLGGGKKKDGPVNNPKGGPGRRTEALGVRSKKGPGTGNKGGPGRRVEALGVRSKHGPATNNTPKGGPGRRSGYKPVGKRRSVSFAMRRRSHK